MLALIYLALAIYLGDLLCRRFYWFAYLDASLGEGGCLSPNVKQ
jgi:hypothetical protein